MLSDDLLLMGTAQANFDSTSMHVSRNRYPRFSFAIFDTSTRSACHAPSTAKAITRLRLNRCRAGKCLEYASCLRKITLVSITIFTQLYQKRNLTSSQLLMIKGKKQKRKMQTTPLKERKRENQSLMKRISKKVNLLRFAYSFSGYHKNRTFLGDFQVTFSGKPF